MQKRIIEFLHEPLVHFFIIAGILYILQIRSDTPEEFTTVNNKINCHENLLKLKRIWQKEWGRKPSVQEIRLLEKQSCQNELLFIHALESGLAKEDNTIYRRLIQKEKEMLQVQVVKKIDTDILKSYYQKHIDDYRKDGTFSFCQVFISLSHDNPLKKANQLLHLLEYADGISCKNLKIGDIQSQYHFYDMQGKEIEKKYGKSFYKQLRLFKIGEWNGPLISSKGIHLILITAHKKGEVLPFNKIKTLVERDYRHQKIKKRMQQQIQKLQEKYSHMQSK